MRNVALLLILVAPVPAGAEPPALAQMILVVGAGGTAEYSQTFAGWADQWKAAAIESNIEYHEVGPSAEQVDQHDRDQLLNLLDQHATASTSPLWLILIGHGTYDRNEAKFNLRGPDVSATELKARLDHCQRPVISVNCFSCSGAFLNPLSGQDRVVITATNSGAELNYSRFGGYLAESLSDKVADLDHDDQVSLLEAYLLASDKVARFYQSESRLATEHALLDDNGDGKGTPADFFVGIRAEGKSKSGAAPDGRLAHRHILVPSKNVPQLTTEQIMERDQLEAEIESLRDEKKSTPEEVYYGRLEGLMLKLAELYEDS